MELLALHPFGRDNRFNNTNMSEVDHLDDAHIFSLVSTAQFPEYSSSDNEDEEDTIDAPSVKSVFIVVYTLLAVSCIVGELLLFAFVWERGGWWVWFICVGCVSIYALFFFSLVCWVKAKIADVWLLLPYRVVLDGVHSCQLMCESGLLVSVVCVWSKRCYKVVLPQ